MEGKKLERTKYYKTENKVKIVTTHVRLHIEKVLTTRQKYEIWQQNEINNIWLTLQSGKNSKFSILNRQHYYVKFEKQGHLLLSIPSMMNSMIIIEMVQLITFNYI